MFSFIALKKKIVKKCVCLGFYFEIFQIRNSFSVIPIISVINRVDPLLGSFSNVNLTPGV